MLLRGVRRGLSWCDAWANRIYGSRYNPLYHSGAIVIALLLIMIVTGLYLLLFYRIGSPWASVARITDQAWAGRWIRGVHRFSADAAVVAAAVHALRMLVQRRSWGPRALAWVSGVMLLGLVFVSGWTGYVLVWDEHARLLAVEGARLLDVLPIMADPVSRTFVGERPMPSAFFFLNLFLHIALPIGAGILIWVHVARLARPRLLPPRPVTVMLVLGLVVLAVAWPVSIAPEANAFRIPASVPLDVFYGFWLPLASRLPPWLVWLAGGSLVLAVVLIPWWARPPAISRPPAAVVDERACTGCEQCMLDCPYDAIEMIERVDGRVGLVARVDSALCVGCGVCIGSCGPMTIGPPGATGKDQLAAARALIERTSPGPSDVVVIGCWWSAASSRNALGSALAFPVGCTGSLHTSTIEQFVRAGAGGVMVVACPERDCRSREGSHWLRERIHSGRAAELKARVDRERIRIVEAGAGESGRLAAELAAFTAETEARARAAGLEEPVDLIDLCRTGVEGEPAGAESGA